MKEPLITMKRKTVHYLSVFALLLAELAVTAFGQESTTNQTPEIPSFRTRPGQLLDRLLTKPPEVVGTETVIASNLRGVIIVKSREEIQAHGVPDVRGIDVREIPLLSGEDFQEVVAPYLGRPLTVPAIKNLQRDIILYCRAKHRPVVDVILPEQTIQNGVIQLWFLEGKVGTVTVQPVGKKWSNDKVILDQVQLRTGNPVDSRRLTEDLDWLNRNPFRHVDAQFRPGADVGQSDVVLLSQERFPFRFYVGGDDAGTDITGDNQVMAGFSWGNAFGVGHQLSYQYLTDTDFDHVHAYSGSYLIPLPWRHILTVFGSYVDAKGDLSSVSSSFDENGHSYQASMRYGIPLPAFEKYRHELTLGFDYKSSNNNLLFGGTTVTKSSPEIDQFVLGYQGLLSDRFGQTAFGFNIYVSPGDLTANNNNDAFALLRPEAKADYAYVRFNIERDTRLPGNFSAILRITTQFTSDRLLPSEMLGIGGYSTVRGYDERIASGDEGWVLSSELRTPPISLLRLAPELLPGQAKQGEKAAGPRTYADQLQFLVFLDHGSAHLNQVQDGEDATVDLASAGAGVRYVISRYFSMRFDYGWQLKSADQDVNDSGNSRGHIGMELSY